MFERSAIAAVIGAGPAGLIAAETLARAGIAVTVYERMPSVARKFLLAGRGGLNLTHGEALPQFLSRYGKTAPALRQAIETFPPERLRAWSEELGEPTFVGSSGRVFPKSFKTSPLLRAWLRRLMNELGVRFALRHCWTGWDDAGRLRFMHGNEEVTVEADATVLALGGASWPRLGSDASWVPLLEARRVAISRLRPANCGMVVQWSDAFRRFEGAPLKRISIQFGEHNVRGEAVITRDGLEGGAIYALSGALRDAIERNGSATIAIDLRPDLSADALVQRLAAPRGKQSLANFLRKAVKLSPLAAGLLREVPGTSLAAMSTQELAALIKAVPITLIGVQPIARAISTAGGVSFDAVDERFMLTALPGLFAAGEMLDWEAPTGGYLLQASFATGVAAAKGAIAWIKKGSPENSAATNP